MAKNSDSLLPDSPWMDPLDPFLGVSPQIQSLRADALKVAQGNGPVLIQGETGTGKGVLAKWLHWAGPRREAPFVDLNCAGLNPDFLETELFGHRKGAFTGADQPKRGLIELADQGTLFLDEIGDMETGVQAKVLKVIEEKRFRRLGEVQDQTVDIRLVAATHQNLEKSIRLGRFRRDLFFRISTFTLSLPPLRQRLQDLPVLSALILAELSRELGKPGLTLAKLSIEAMEAHRWPGNIRELRNSLERAAIRCEDREIWPEDLGLAGGSAEATPAYGTRLSLAELEKLHIKRVLEEEGGRVTDAAKRLGIPRSTLYVKIKELGLGGE
ncbi:MAG: sigma-54-dependent Fis family transcriptional regulator [Holophagaceae bacterium]|nr:sigma-54-dependent Fis family transcriptional regulator [Holophagaceae bacterium]